MRELDSAKRAVILHEQSQAGWVQQAIEFAERGSTVRFIPWVDGKNPEPTVPVVDLTGTSKITSCWRLTDTSGRDIAMGAAAATAVTRGEPTLDVQLRAGALILASGTVKVRRRMGGTIASAMESLGPLLAVALLAPLNAPAGVGTSVAPSRRRADVTAVVRTAGQAARAAVTCRRWSVARWPGDLDDLLRNPGPVRTLNWFGPRASAFWADPHVVVADGQEWVFVEELVRSTGLGSIRASQFVDGDLVGRDVVLSTSHHLSFPQVYRVGSRWLATVETCAAENPIYTFDRLGSPWRIAPDLPALPPHLADPVLFFHEDGSLAQVWGSDGRLDPDAVFIRYDWADGRWQRVDSATEVNVTRSRNGGSIDRRRDLRAVQDCGESYGAAAELLDLSGRRRMRLTSTDVGRGNDHRRRKGVHTITWDESGDAVWIDSWYRRPTLLGGWLRVREQHHARRCTG